MTPSLLLQGLGATGVFAGRAFVPAFATALLLRFGPHVPGLAHLGLLPEVRRVPVWFASDLALVVLGAMAALEVVADRSVEARAFLVEVRGYLKAGMAALTYLGVASATDRAAVAPMLQQAGVFDVLPALLVAAGTLAVGRVHEAVVAPLADADEDDDLGLRRLLRWAGDLWGLLGPLALIVLPIVCVAALALAVLALWAIERRLAGWGDRQHVACAHCGHPIHASAPTCSACQTPVAEPRAVGLLGQAKAKPADPARLPFDLVAVKRCPNCATRLARRSAHQTCPTCGHDPLTDPAFAPAYIASIDRRVPLACAVGLGLGLVPVLGVIPGVIAYRLLIVAPFRRYIPAGRGLLVRWGVRLATVALVGLQWVPVAGGLSLPAMGLLSYAAYRTAYRQQAVGA